MKTNVFLAPLVLVLAFAIPALWSGQVGEQQPGQQPGRTSGAQTQTAAGELARVDEDNKSFWIKAADGTEMEFKYNDQTQVTGAADSPEALAGKDGSRVSVQFSKMGADNMASRIEVLPRQ
jgi:hypothetical protein